ncbi:MAG: pyridoxamine 5'-phosphate oxidase family protein [Thermomicrobiales bacterium]
MERDQILDVLNDPVAQRLISSNTPVRFAYTGLDGFPRVVPLSFHWNGSEFVVSTIPCSAKVRALQANPKVAMTIDTETQPPKVLLVRGLVTVGIVDGVPSEYIDGSRKLIGEENVAAFEEQVRAMYPQMAKITITPEWAKIHDFETRVPSAAEEAFNRMSRSSFRSGVEHRHAECSLTGSRRGGVDTSEVWR